MSWLPAAAEAWWCWMAPVSVQVAGLALGAALVERLMGRHAWPQLRAALWLTVMARLVVPPSWSSPISIVHLLPAHQPVDAEAAPATSTALPALAFAVWLAGFLLASVAVVRRSCQLRRWLALTRAAPQRAVAAAQRAAARLGLRRMPSLRVASARGSPAVSGIRRPVVVLPHQLLAPGAAPDLENALLHELAHLKRRDPLRSALSLAVQLVYWFHPGVWLARSRLATLREIGCDATVARCLGAQTASYRRTLLGFARRLVEPAPAPRLALVRRGSEILARLDWLDRPPPRWPRLRGLATAVLFGLLLACCVPLARRPAALPPLAFADLQGCLQKRFYVLGLLARREQPSQTLENQ